MIPRSAIAALLTLPLLSSCILVAGAGAGVLVARELENDEVERRVELPVDIELAWEGARRALEGLGADEIQTAEHPRRMIGEVEPGALELEFVSAGPNRTELRLRGIRGLGRSDAELAERGLEAVLAELDVQLD